MTRKLFGAALALALAGGVYLAAAPAEASNMGFKLEREFQPVDTFKNEFYVSFPLFNGLDPDLANTAATEPNKCVGPGGPPTGDGILNADDAICDLWTDPLAKFELARYDLATCSFEVRFAYPDPFTLEPNFDGTWTTPLPRDEGFRVIVEYLTGVTNSAVIVGSHDPSYTGRTLQPNGTCQSYRQLAYLNVPYHTMYKNALEILCGLEGPTNDWERDGTTGEPIWHDLTGDTVPDQCANGIFDGDATITVSWWDNVNDDSGPTGGDTDNTSINCRVAIDGFTGDVTFPFGHACYDLVPGESYYVQLDDAHAATTYRSPHF